MHPEINRQIASLRVQDMQAAATAARRAKEARRARRGAGLLAVGRSPRLRPGLALRHT